MITLLITLASAVTSPAQVAPLVPSGSVLTSVPGILVRPTDQDPWTLRLTGDASDPEGRLRDFTLMPCKVLEEMEQVQAGSTEPPVFIVTGEVTRFGNRNWIMPSHAEIQAIHAARDVPAETPPAPGGHGDLDDDGMREGASAGDSIADIVADLQRSVERLPKSLDDGQPRGVQSESTPPDSTLILSRRGRLLRGRHGAWVFVLDSDAWGTADPPAVLLPSPMLEQLIRSGRRADYRTPIHLSGSLTTYRGRQFIVPTAISSLRERPNLRR